MALLELKSTNPDFSWLIGKQPGSPMQPRSLRFGMAKGWWPNGSSQEYAIWFQDALKKSSFGHEDLKTSDYNDTSRYNSPLFPIEAIRDYFRTAWSGVHEKDVLGFEHEIVLNQVYFRSERYLEIFRSHFVDKCEIVTETLSPKNLRVTIRSKGTLHDLLGLSVLLCLFTALKNDEDFIVFEDAMKAKFFAMVNRLDAPYFIRYVCKTNLLPNPGLFKRFQGTLDTENIEMTFGNTQEQRVDTIRELFHQTLDVVDFGCGEGSYIKALATRQQEGRFYYAIDKNERSLSRASFLVRKKKLKNVRLLDQSPEFKSPYQAILTEVIEHNSLVDATQIVDRFLDDPLCWSLIVTTPNKDFNVHYNLDDDETRHGDHVFEFTQAEFSEWLKSLNDKFEDEWSIYGTSVGDKVCGVKPIFFAHFKRSHVDFEQVPPSIPAQIVKPESTEEQAHVEGNSDQDSGASNQDQSADSVPLDRTILFREIHVC